MLWAIYFFKNSCPTFIIRKCPCAISSQGTIETKIVQCRSYITTIFSECFFQNGQAAFGIIEIFVIPPLFFENPSHYFVAKGYLWMIFAKLWFKNFQAAAAQVQGWFVIPLFKV